MVVRSAAKSFRSHQNCVLYFERPTLRLLGRCYGFELKPKVRCPKFLPQTLDSPRCICGQAKLWLRWCPELARGLAGSARAVALSVDRQFARQSHRGCDHEFPELAHDPRFTHAERDMICDAEIAAYLDGSVVRGVRAAAG